MTTDSNLTCNNQVDYVRKNKSGYVSHYPEIVTRLSTFLYLKKNDNYAVIVQKFTLTAKNNCQNYCC